MRETSFHGHDASGEEAGLRDQSSVGPFIDVDGTVSSEAVEKPEGTIANRMKVGKEARMERGFGETFEVERGEVFRRVCLCSLDGLVMADNTENVSWVGGASDNGCHASGRGETGSDNFRGHAAGSEGRASGGDVDCERGYIFNHFDGLSVGVDTRIFVV